MSHVRSQITGWTPAQLPSLERRSFVITGANSGVGFEAARTLLSVGATVIMMNRSVHKSHAALDSLRHEFGDDAKVQFVRMDLSDLGSVRTAAEELLAKAPRIDALICNAAIAQVPTRKLTKDGFESQFGTNHLGHFLLCGLVFERIDQSGGRMVMVGSGGYRMGEKRIHFEDIDFETGYSAWNAYSQSKLAQMMFGYELERRVSSSGRTVGVRVCHPGASKTNLIDSSAGLLNRLIWSVASRVMAQSAERGAWPEVMCAVEDNLEPRALYGPTRRGETVGPVGRCKLDPCALDEEQAVRLWAVSEERTGLRWSP